MELKSAWLDPGKCFIYCCDVVQKESVLAAKCFHDECQLANPNDLKHLYNSSSSDARGATVNINMNTGKNTSSVIYFIKIFLDKWFLMVMIMLRQMIDFKICSW